MEPNQLDDQYALVWSKKIKAVNVLGGKCKKCGESNIFLLEFHHTSEDKEKNINKLQNYRWSKLLKEVQKCALLCGNCHKETHCNGNRNSQTKTKFLINHKLVRCNNCGYKGSNDSSLDFHHFRGEKKFNLSDALSRKKKSSVADVLNELEKCKILCCNCHKKEHFNLERFNRLKDAIYKKIDGYKEDQKPLNRDEVWKMYNSGMRQVDIVKHFGCSKGTVSSLLKKLRLNKGVPNEKPS